MMMLPYRDKNAYELIRKYKNDLAMVVIEPVQSSNPRLDSQEFLEGLRDVCTAVSYTHLTLPTSDLV